MKSCREWKRFQSEPYRSSRSSCLLMRKPPLLVRVALANKMARGIWAMLTRGEDYRDPVMATA